MILVLRAIITVLTISLSVYLSADGMPSQLSVKPDRCIALHQGQVCYQTITLKWQTPTYGEYCLFDQRQAKPLLCWVGDQKNMHVQEFTSSQSVSYHIRTKASNKKVSEVRIKVAWVYQSNRKSSSSWRLF